MNCFQLQFLRKYLHVILSPSASSPRQAPRGKLGTSRTGSAKRGIVILSPALGGTKDLEILRLPPQNDVTGQPPSPEGGGYGTYMWKCKKKAVALEQHHGLLL
jgi:hypothetical protein